MALNHSLPADRGRYFPVAIQLVATLFFALLLSTAPGCSKSASDGTLSKSRSTSQGSPTDSDAARILHEVVAAYRATPAYGDRGQIHLKFERGTQKIDESANFSVLFVRPNKIRLDCYQALVVCDARQLRAAIGDLSGQVLSVPAPETLTFDSLLADPVLAGVLTGGVAGSMPQIALLLADDPLVGILADAQPPKLIEPQAVDGQMCDRVELQRDDGRLVFWIDQQSRVIRRIDYPTDALAKQIGGGSDEVKGLALWAEFPDARLMGEMNDAAFRFDFPAEAKLVEHFKVDRTLPEPPPISPLLGKPIGEFEFTTLDGRRVTRESIAGKVAVFDFWATWCGPCKQSLPRLESVYQQFKDRKEIVFFAVSIDEAKVDAPRLRQTFAQLGIQIPMARDVSQFADQTFHVEGIPNLFIVGPDGTVEDNEIGVNPQLEQVLPERLNTLLAGESIYPAALKRYERRKAQYEQAKRAQQDAGTPPSQPVEKAEIAPHRDPRHLVLTRLWTCHEVARPGNLLVVPGDGDREMLVLDGWRRVVRIDRKGQIAERFDLDVPSDAIISVLRTAVDASGRRFFAGTASTRPQAYLFSEDWSLKFGFPNSGDAEIAEAELADLDADGEPELYVGYWGPRGVQRVALDGKSVWINDKLENVYSIAVAAAEGASDGQLLCANARGNLVALDSSGRQTRQINVSGRFVRAIRAADLDGDGQDELCGLSPSNAGNDTALGIGANGEVLWTYELPAGLHQQSIEMVGTATWPLEPRGGWWMLAGADGSIQFLAADGKLVDRFQYGSELTGLAATVWDDQAVLLVATVEGIDAWKVQSK